jgi:hypothetical protein
MRRDGEAFRCGELADALHAAVEDRMQRIELPADGRTGDDSASLHAFKGTRPRPPTACEALPDGRLRFPRGSELGGFEWHPLEEHPSLGAFRWTGPARTSTIILPVRIDRAIDVSLLLISSITDDTLRTARLDANGIPLDTRFVPGPEGTLLWVGRVDPARMPNDDREELRLSITVDSTHRPFDRGFGTDRRWVGLAVGRVELGPGS